MISAVHSHAAVPAAAPGASQVYSVSLDSDMLALLYEAMRNAGLDTSKLPATPAPRQETAAPDPSANVAPPDPAAAPFVPQFQQAKLSGYDGASYALNPDFFATRESAQWIANKYGTGELVEVKVGGENPGGPYAADKPMLNIKMKDGRLINAGQLASYYARNPENLFPGVADKLILNLLAS